MNSAGALREPASPITPGVGLLLFALKVGKYVLITVDWRWMSHFGFSFNSKLLIDERK